MLLTALLGNYSPFDSVETAMLARLQFFLRENHTLFGREVVGPASIQGHITATGWIIDVTRTRTLLTYHAKTGEWLPPGEHGDDSADLREIALLIAHRATGLSLTPLGTELFDVNIRRVPEYWNTPEHWHYEVCFAMQAADATPSVAPTQRTRWVSLDDVHTLNADACLARLVTKTRRLLAR